MPRTIGSSGAKTVAAIRRAGLRLIYKHGYEAMSLRQLAAEVGILQGSLYNHIQTKQHLLFELLTVHMHELLKAADETLSTGGPAIDRLRQFVQFHVRYHMSRRQEVFICYSELRSLETKNLRAIVALRNTYESKLTDILQAGITERSFQCNDAKVATYGILSMLSGIVQWFNSRGRLSKDEIAELFTTMAVNSVMNPSPDGVDDREPLFASKARPPLGSVLVRSN